MYFLTGNGVQVNIRDIITIGAQTLTSFGNGLFLCAQDGHIVAQVPSIGTGTPTSLTNGQFLYANNGSIGSKTIGLADTTDGVIKAGDTVASGSTWAYGSLMTSSKEIYLSIPLGKMITASSATVVSGTMTIRTVGGYAYDKASASGGTYSGLDITDFSPSVTIVKSSGNIRIKVTNSTKWVNSSGTALTNNTPVTAAVNLSIRFS